MKVRTDFITNSSSSTFVVAFLKKIVDFEDVRYLINREAKARQVLKDALAQKPRKINPKNKSLIQLITTELTYGYSGLGYSEFQEKFCKREGITSGELYKNNAWMQTFSQEFHIVEEKICSKKAVKFLDINEGNYLYIFKYGDESGEFFSEMEHGFTFEKVPHITINKH